MRAANHHGRGTARHVGRKDFSAPHIDKKRSRGNLYWVWDSRQVTKGQAPDIEQSELHYYSQTFSGGLDVQNEKYKKKRQYKYIRAMDDIYRSRQTQPEESLLYIGDRSNKGAIPVRALWDCATEYVRWETAYSRSHGDCYKVLSLTLHVDEDGQIHMHERGVYQYRDSDGNWRIGQAKALEAAGIPLPEPGKPRGRYNNRKMTWDATRREKWLDIVESHGYVIEREPEKDRPHVPLEVWKIMQDEHRAAEEERESLRSREDALKDREMLIQAKEAALTEISRPAYQRLLQKALAEQRGREADAELQGCAPSFSGSGLQL